MQEQINDKTISLCITGGKISGKILKFAITKALAKMEKHKREKAAEKNTTVYHGKQSMDSSPDIHPGPQCPWKQRVSVWKGRKELGLPLTTSGSTGKSFF